MVTPTRPPFKFIVKAENSLEQLGHVFSVTLSRVKVVFLMPPFPPMFMPRLATHYCWRMFFSSFHLPQSGDTWNFPLNRANLNV